MDFETLDDEGLVQCPMCAYLGDTVEFIGDLDDFTENLLVCPACGVDFKYEEDEGEEPNESGEEPAPYKV